LQLFLLPSYDEYASRAFRFSAIDYLLKPIDHEELKKAVLKVSEHILYPLPKLEILLQKIHHQPVPINKIAVSTMEGLPMIPVDSILSCPSDRNYTAVLFKGKQKITVSKILKEIEEMPDEYLFLRLHQSILLT
jgi:two-component system LytT family response regulator